MSVYVDDMRAPQGKISMRPFGIGPSRPPLGVERLGPMARHIADMLERERLRLEIRAVLNVGDDEARQLEKDFDAQDVVNAGALGWKPGDPCSPRLFVLANRVSW